MLQETTELPGNYVLIKFSDGAQVVLVNDGDVKHYLDGSERGERMRYLIDRRAKAINGQLPGMLLIG